MTRITFTDFAGTSRAVDADEGMTLKDVALENDIPGIEADCGGMCACATCHVFVDQSFMDRVGPPTDAEAPMLEFLDDAKANSRLACQIEVTGDLEGLHVITPESQY